MSIDRQFREKSSLTVAFILFNIKIRFNPNSNNISIFMKITRKSETRASPYLHSNKYKLPLIENTIISGAERLRKLGPFEFPPPVAFICPSSLLARNPRTFRPGKTVAREVSSRGRLVKFVSVVYFYVSRLFAATLPVWPENGTTPPVTSRTIYFHLCNYRLSSRMSCAPPLMSPMG